MRQVYKSQKIVGDIQFEKLWPTMFLGRGPNNRQMHKRIGNNFCHIGHK